MNKKQAAVTGMTFDPDHPNVKELKRKYPQTWRQMMAQSQGLTNAEQAQPIAGKIAMTPYAFGKVAVGGGLLLGAGGGALASRKGKRLHGANHGMARMLGLDLGATLGGLAGSGAGYGLGRGGMALAEALGATPKLLPAGAHNAGLIGALALGVPGAAYGAYRGWGAGADVANRITGEKAPWETDPADDETPESKSDAKDKKEKTAMTPFEFGIKVAQSSCSYHPMPNGPTNKKHMTSASPAVLDASQKSEEIGKPQTTETEHSAAKAKMPEEGVKSALAFGAKMAKLDQTVAMQPKPPQPSPMPARPLSRRSPKMPTMTPAEAKADPLPPKR